MAKTIPVSFKENEKDMDIYNFLNDMEDGRSGYVKKAVRFYRDYQRKLIEENPRSRPKVFDEEEEGIGEILGI